MDADIRAVVAAVAFAAVKGAPVAGLFDHDAACDRRIAAECRGDRVQGFDGGRHVAFGGTLPEIRDEGTGAFVAMAVAGERVTGFDRASGSHFEARVGDGVVQVFDHERGAWFAFDVQDAAAASRYLRGGAG